MPAQIYDKGRERYTRGLGDWENDGVVMLMVSDAYQFDPAHVDQSDIPPEAILFSAPLDIALRTGVDGYLDGAGVFFDTIDREVVVSALIIVANGTLLLYSDDAIGLPLRVYPGSVYLVRPDEAFGGFGRL